MRVLVVLAVLGLVSGCSTSSTDANDPNRAATVRHVTQLLAQAPILPGAVEVRSAPAPELTGIGQHPSSDNLIDQTRWWTAPGTATAAATYLTSHPGDLRVEGGGTSSGNGVSVRTVDLATTESWAGTEDSAQLVFTLVDVDGHVAVRGDAQAIWIPTRSGSSRLPGHLTSVDVTVLRGGTSPIVQGHLTGDAVSQLVESINALSVEPPGTRNCPAAVEDSNDTLVFHGAAADVTVIVHRSGCAAVTVSTAPQTALIPADQVHQLLFQLLGVG